MIAANDAGLTSETIIAGFHELLEREPGIISGFLAAFEQRREIAGVPETRGISDGLEDVLAGILSSVFTLEQPSQELQLTEVSDSFIQDFDRVVRSFPQRHPGALYLFKKHLLRYRCTPAQALAAIFHHYIKNVEVYPY